MVLLLWQPARSVRLLRGDGTLPLRLELALLRESKVGECARANDAQDDDVACDELCELSVAFRNTGRRKEGGRTRFEGPRNEKGRSLPVTNLPTPPAMSNTPLKMSAMKAKKPAKRLKMPMTKECTMVYTAPTNEARSS